MCRFNMLTYVKHIHYHIINSINIFTPKSTQPNLKSFESRSFKQTFNLNNQSASLPEVSHLNWGTSPLKINNRAQYYCPSSPMDTLHQGEDWWRPQRKREFAIWLAFHGSPITLIRWLSNYLHLTNYSNPRQGGLR